MADFGTQIDYKIKSTIDNKLNPYLKMIRDKMRTIDKKSTDAVIEVEKMLKEFLIEYNLFRQEVAGYVEELSGLEAELEQIRIQMTDLGNTITSMTEEVYSISSNLTGLTNTYNNHLKRHYYAICHYVDGGTPVRNYSIIEGQTITEPHTEKEGYNFDAWYFDDTFTNKVNFPLTIIDNYDLYARFTEKVYYTVTFVSPYGSVEPITVEAGHNINLPTLEEEGYIFDGWFTDETYQTKVTSPLTVNSNMTLYAKWTAIIYYTVSFITGYDYTVDPITVEENTIISLPVLERENYIFDGWMDTNGNIVASPYTVASNMTLTAQWTATVITYTYYSEMPIRYIREALTGCGGRRGWYYVAAYKDGVDVISKETATVSTNFDYNPSLNGNITNILTENNGSKFTLYHNNSIIQMVRAAFTVDLGSPQLLDSIVVKHEFNGNNYTQIDVSTDGVKWYPVRQNSTVSQTSTDDLTTTLWVDQPAPENSYATMPIKKIKLDVGLCASQNNYGVQDVEPRTWYDMRISPLSAVGSDGVEVPNVINGKVEENYADNLKQVIIDMGTPVTMDKIYLRWARDFRANDRMSSLIVYVAGADDVYHEVYNTSRGYEYTLDLQQIQMT